MGVLSIQEKHGIIFRLIYKPNPEPSSGNAFVNMFGDNSVIQPEESKEEKIEEEKKEDTIRIIEY